MGFLSREKDTICALTTPQGRSGIAVIRVSGPDTLSIIKKLNNNLPEIPESHKIYYGKILDTDLQAIDEVLFSYFADNKSYTGQETIEISCHGNPIIINKILRNLVKAGCRTAERGEFTYRAFINQKIDLVQAESVLSLIESQSEKAASLSLRQLEGDLTKVLLDIEDKLTFILANLEASIDFVEEDIDIIDYTALENASDKVLKSIDKLLTSYKDGRVLKEGYRVALVGKPNAGKSSLLNSLLEEEKAIVSPIPGTTRDVVEGTIHLEGVSIQFYDTAGIHSTDDIVEKMGIERSQKKLDDADLVLYLVDINAIDNSIDIDLVSKISNKNSYIVASKIDLVHQDLDLKMQKLASHSAISEILHGQKKDSDSESQCLLKSSAHTGEGKEQILEIIRNEVSQLYSQDSAVLCQARHFELLSFIKKCLVKSMKMIEDKESAEFISFELHEGIFKLHEVLGKRFDDQVMDRVFKEFCIGK